MGAAYCTENGIPIRRLSEDELLIGGKKTFLCSSMPSQSLIVFLALLSNLS